MNLKELIKKVEYWECNKCLKQKHLNPTNKNKD